MIVTLYSRPGCHLCQEVRDLLDDLAPAAGATIDEINIEEDPALFESYRYEIPVLCVDGKEIARGRIHERAVISALRPRS